jgi:hypothetical protein
MTTPSRIMVIWGRTTERRGRGGGRNGWGNEGWPGWGRGRASRVETASLFAVDRSPRWLVVREAWWSRAGPGERCDPTRAWLVAVKRWRLARCSRNSALRASPAHLTPGSQHPDGSDNYDPCCSTVATLTRIPTVALGPSVRPSLPAPTIPRINQCCEDRLRPGCSREPLWRRQTSQAVYEPMRRPGSDEVS